MALQACAIVLDVRNKHGLPERQDKIFNEWLKVRDVATASGAYHFGFEQLEQWIAETPRMLLDMLGNDYVSLLASEVSSGRGRAIDLQGAAIRVDQVFEELANGGQESRETLWPLVIDLVSSPSLELQGSALTALELYHHLAAGRDLSQCVGAVAAVLRDHPKPEADYKRGFAWLLPTATAQFEHLQQNTKDVLSALNTSLSTADGLQQDSVALFEKVIKQDRALLHKVTDTWVEWLPDTLSMGCAKALFESFELLEDSAQESIVTYLDTGFDTNQTPLRYDNLYGMAIKSIPTDAWNDGVLHEHLDRSLGKLPSKVSNDLGELEPIAEGISKVYLHGTAAVVAASLRDTFNTARSYPPQHNLLHEYFAGTWPSAETVTPGYDPETIFTQSIAVGIRYPSDAEKGLLASLDSMIEADLVEPASKAALIELACVIWQTNLAEAYPFLAKTRAIFTPAQLVMLADAVDWKDSGEVTMLQVAWTNLTSHLLASDNAIATKQLLAKGPLGTTALPDQGLTLWVGALETSAYSALKDTVLDEATADEGRRRLWRQIISLTTQPPLRDLINLACKVVQAPSAPQTVIQVTEDLGAIIPRLSDQTSKLEVSQQLMRVLPQCALLTTKQALAKHAFDHGSPAVLTSVDASTLNEADVEIIEAVFGKKPSEVKALKRRFAKQRSA